MAACQKTLKYGPFAPMALTLAGTDKVRDVSVSQYRLAPSRNRVIFSFFYASTPRAYPAYVSQHILDVDVSIKIFQEARGTARIAKKLFRQAFRILEKGCRSGPLPGQARIWIPRL